MFARFEVFRTLLSVFMSIFKVYVRYELWVHVPVAIFFGAVVCNSPRKANGTLATYEPTISASPPLFFLV